MSVITETIEYLKNNRDRMLKYRTVPGTDILDARARETVNHINQLIDELSTYIEYEHEFIEKVRLDKLEAWKTYEEENKRLFKS